MDAFTAAQTPDGKHHGFYLRYKDEPSFFLESGIRALEKRLGEHEAKVVQPDKYVPEFSALPEHQQASLIANWMDEIANFREQISILQGILERRTT
jgi:hypothetical protein